jgi:ABC-type Fe3+/spermidine/putrescine transport system ATPase subunit
MDTVLELRGVTKHYPGHTAVEDLSLTVGAGEFFALLGPSGCGKTTTLRLVAGFEAPSRGEILLEDRRLDGLPPYERNVSTVFQNYALFPHLTVADNIAFGLRHRRGGAPGDARQRIAAAVEMLDLGAKLERKPGELSGGEQQRVALARSLVVQPAVLLLDEPLAALDPNLRKQVRGELKSLQRRVGIAFVFVTHDQEEALSVSDRIALLRGGRLEQSGPPEEIYLRPKTRFAASFLGPINWVGPIGVRPEATRLAARAPDGGVPAMPATVENTVFLGNSVHVEVRLDSGERATAEVSRLEKIFGRGERVHVWWRPEDEQRLPEP